MDSSPPSTDLRLRPRAQAKVAAAGLIALLSVVPVAAYEVRPDGVVCDDRQRVCYDQSGPSLNQTRRRYGNNAERNLWGRLSGRPSTDTAILSSGELCDFRRQICWDDGWRRSNISYRLSRHLFGSDFDRIERDRYQREGRQCVLRQGNRNIFSGRCRFLRVEDSGRVAYVVETDDRRRYRFQERSGRLWLSDATGSWPVSTRRNRDTLQLRWANLQLDIDRYRDGDFGDQWDEQRLPYDSDLPTQIIQQMFEGLFR